MKRMSKKNLSKTDLKDFNCFKSADILMERMSKKKELDLVTCDYLAGLIDYKNDHIISNKLSERFDLINIYKNICNLKYRMPSYTLDLLFEFTEAYFSKDKKCFSNKNRKNYKYWISKIKQIKCFSENHDKLLLKLTSSLAKNCIPEFLKNLNIYAAPSLTLRSISLSKSSPSVATGGVYCPEYISGSLSIHLFSIFSSKLILSTLIGPVSAKGSSFTPK